MGHYTVTSCTYGGSQHALPAQSHSRYVVSICDAQTLSENTNYSYHKKTGMCSLNNILIDFLHFSFQFVTSFINSTCTRSPLLPCLKEE